MNSGSGGLMLVLRHECLFACPLLAVSGSTQMWRESIQRILIFGRMRRPITTALGEWHPVVVLRMTLRLKHKGKDVYLAQRR